MFKQKLYLDKAKNKLQSYWQMWLCRLKRHFNDNLNRHGSGSTFTAVIFLLKKTIFGPFLFFVIVASSCKF